MKTSVMNPVRAFTLVALGLANAAMGIYVANADDAPGAAGLGMLLMVTGVVLGLRALQNRLPTWAARTALVLDDNRPIKPHAQLFSDISRNHVGPASRRKANDHMNILRRISLGGGLL